MEQVVWKDVPGYDGLYKISSFGEIVSLKRNRPKLLTVYICDSGYLAVTLYKNGREHICTLHRTFAIVFIPNPHNLPVVNHKDGDKLNIAPDNLEWTSHAGNIKHAYDTGLRKSRKGNPIRKSKLVYQFTFEKIFVRSYTTPANAARENYILKHTMLQALSSKHKVCKGFLWSYDKNDSFKSGIKRIAEEITLTHNGIEKSVVGWAKEIGISRHQAYYFLIKKKISIHQAFLLKHNNKEKPVVQVDIFGKVLNKFHNAKAASQINKVDAGHICKVCKGERKTAGGFIWQYA